MLGVYVLVYHESGFRRTAVLLEDGEAVLRLNGVRSASAAWELGLALGGVEKEEGRLVIPDEVGRYYAGALLVIHRARHPERYLETLAKGVDDERVRGLLELLYDTALALSKFFDPPKRVATKVHPRAADIVGYMARFALARLRSQ